MEQQYLDDAEAAGVDVTSSYEGREGTSVDVFNVCHLQLAVSARTHPLQSNQGLASAFEESRTHDIPSKRKSQKKFKHPHGLGEAWR